jgi:DNA-binding MarR family transcriptional regulator
MRAFDLHSKTLLKDVGLTGPQLMILSTVTKSGRITVTEIAKQVSLSQATVTNVLTRLERQGLVTRTRDDVDKRKVDIEATEKTKEILEGGPGLLQWDFYERFSQIKDWEQSLLVYAVQRLADMMEPHGPDPRLPKDRG